MAIIADLAHTLGGRIITAWCIVIVILLLMFAAVKYDRPPNE